ncbi:MAG TPA: DUF460 domain-containing protein [Candidatus Aenigmarchaeota archaeon]|nr:DUF460 domain-containing protein [Candidatus Aenigmarchaeota archaeon]HEX32793.1 DUF460 domain-containing protein [Candidatus Aenigmarchaeota archaeon]
MVTYAILGVDFGTTTAMSLVDLCGNLMFYSSRRNGGIKFIVSTASSIAVPVIVAVDVLKPPRLSKRIASFFNAVLVKPDHNLLLREKISLARGYKYSNDHERDAIASAFYAYKRYRRLFDKIGHDDVSHEIKKRIIKGESHSIHQAIIDLKQ